jgi:hypothetical protein
MTRLAFLSLCLLVFTIPWQTAVAFEGFGTIARVLGALAFGITIWSVIADGKIRPLSVIQVLMMLFLAWAVLTAAWTNAPEASQMSAVTYIQLSMMVWMIWQLATTPERQRTMVQAFVLGTLVVALLTIWNRLTGGVDIGGRYNAVGMNHNDLGYCCTHALAMACYLAATERKAWLFWFYAALMGTLQVGVLLTGSRGATMASLVAWMFLPWVFLRLKTYKKAASVALLAVMVISALAIVPATSWHRLAETGTEIESGSFSRRGPIWRAGWEVFKQHPIIGVGVGAFNSNVAGEVVGPTAAHNAFLAVSVEMGLVGLGLLLGLLFCLMLGCLQLPRFDQRLGLILLMTWSMNAMASNCEYGKRTWFLFGLIAVYVGTRLRLGLEVRRRSATMEEEGLAF